VGAIHYLNSGDWVESLTAIIEHQDGRMELVRYAEFIERLRRGDDALTPAIPPGRDDSPSIMAGII
jgi:hypothetical protein